MILSTLYAEGKNAAGADTNDNRALMQLYNAPDDQSLVVQSVERDEGLSPLAETTGVGGVKWYLVKSRSGNAGWIKTDGSEVGKEIRRFFKALPAEPPPSRTDSMPAAASTTHSSTAVVIPVQMTGSVVVAPVVLNRTARTTMIVDTGASLTVISRALAAQLELQPTSRVSLVTANGIITAPLAKLESLQVGDAEAANLPVLIHDFSPVSGLGGILGFDFLSQFHSTIDSRRRLLILAPH